MKKLLIAAAISVAFTGAAFASNGNGNNGNNNGPVTNTAQGGNGYGLGVGVGVGIGQGGAGGVGIGQGGAGGHGGSVLGSGNSANSNTNRNDNRNSNLNAQGQQQGQGQSQKASAKQGQSQTSRNDNRSNASNTNSNANSGNNSDQSVTVQGDSYEAARIPVATAYAAGLTASNGTCMGSTSAGAQGVGFGISIGSTWNDDNCNRRYNAQALSGLGQTQAAFALLCQDATIAKAVASSGGKCPAVAAQQVASVAQPQRPATEAEAAVQYTGNDPIVRRRLGLPPL